MYKSHGKSWRNHDKFLPNKKYQMTPTHHGFVQRNQTLNIGIHVKRCLNYSKELYLNSVIKKCFGQRKLISEEEELQPNGKIFRKVVLGHYQWFSYNQIDERIENIAKGLLVNGVNPEDNVIIFAETRLEWMISAQAILRIGKRNNLF